MNENKGFHLFDYLQFLVRRKELLVVVFVGSAILTYAGVFLLVEEKFEATSVIIPREDESAGGLASGLLKGMKGMSFNLGSKSMSAEMDMYRTIISSRSMMEDVVRTFNLLSVYRIDTTDVAYMEKAVKRLREEVGTLETEESAFRITVRAVSAQMAADMANYIVKSLNARIIGLNITRSHENRVFLENRIGEITAQLKRSEDSLRAFQERTGLLDVKSQLAGIIEANTTMETDRLAKDLHRGLMLRMYDKNSPQVRELDTELEVIDGKLNQLRTKVSPGSPILPLHQLPKTTVEFLRRYRDVEVNNLLLQYVIPLYEQAKIEEKKDYPVLQVIDQAVPPAKRTYPPRVLFAAVGATGVTLTVLLYLAFVESRRTSTDSRFESFFRESMTWDWRKVRGS